MKSKRIIPHNNDASKVSAVMSKLDSVEKETKPKNLHPENGQGVLTTTKSRLKNNEDILSLFPDTEYSIRLLISSILAPNDLVNVKLNYSIENLVLPDNIKSLLTTTISKYVSKEHKLEDNLPNILEESIFKSGCFARLVVPEASLDEIINADIYKEDLTVQNYIEKLESENTFLGEDTKLELTTQDGTDTKTLFKDAKKSLSFKLKNKAEAELIHTAISNFGVSDNLNLLTANDKLTKLTTQEVSNELLSGNKYVLSNLDNSENLNKALNLLYGNKNTNDKSETDGTIIVSTSEDTVRESIGKPLQMILPAESIIPVHVIGDPSKHIAYFIAIDGNGVPLKVNSKWDSSITAIGGEKGEDAITKAKKALKGITSKDNNVSNMSEIYEEIVTKTLKAKISNGKFKDAVEVAEYNEIYRVMLNRALKDQKTRLLFVPADLVSYYAYDFRENGTGKSLLEKASMLFSFKAILLFNKITASVVNSTTTTEIGVTLDPDDPDQDKTMETIMSLSARARQGRIPWGTLDMNDLVNWTTHHGLSYNFKNNGNLPDLELEQNESTPNVALPEDAIGDEVDKMIGHIFGVTPEMVDLGKEPDFATTIVSKNLLFLKKVIHWQDRVNPFITEDVKRLVINDMDIMEDIYDIVDSSLVKICKGLKLEVPNEIADKEKLIKLISGEVIKSLRIALPKPADEEEENLKKVLEAHTEKLDTIIDIIMGSDALPEELIGELSGKMDYFKGLLKAVLTRKFMVENGYLSEVSEFIGMDGKGKADSPLLKEIEDYVKDFSEVMLPFLKNVNKIKVNTDTKIEKIESGEDDTPPEDNTPESNTDGGEEIVEEPIPEEVIEKPTE